jgi:hypothetical protein
VDPDGDTLTISSVSRPSQGAAAINPDRTITYTPPASYRGTVSFTYAVSDGHGGSDTATVTMTVTGGNSPPAVVSPGNRINVEGALIWFRVSASDPDRQTLRFFTGMVRRAGTYDVTVRASDGFAQGTARFAWRVVRLALAHPGTQTSRVGDAVSLQMQATPAPGSGVDLTFSAMDLPAGLSIDRRTGLISGRLSGRSGHYRTVVTVTASGMVAVETFTWRVMR